MNAVVNTLSSALRVTFGLLFLAVTVTIFFSVCLLVFPSRRLRIRVCNVFGHVTGPVILWFAGATVEGADRERMRAYFPAIYVSNHTSALDIFLGIWLAPVGTVGVAKKEVIWYPFFGQLYLLSGHLRLDRQNRASAVEAMRRTAADVRKFNLGIWMWPEGTRSRDGRLLPFKKGFAHLALATGLPIVPVVVTGAHRGWRKGSLALHKTAMSVRVLDPIPTTNWAAESIDRHIEEVHQVFERALPADQLPALKIPA